MKLKEFYYELPKELIAQSPLDKRDDARLMVVDRDKKSVEHRVFSDIADFMSSGDALVLNNTKVVPARIYGNRKSGGRVEIFIIDTESESPRALIKPSKRIKIGEIVLLDSGYEAVIGDDADIGRKVSFNAPLRDILRSGHIPLPPYISREDTQDDKEKYQTVYAQIEGATAAPTAGLHFTKPLLDRIKAKGVEVIYVTLHTSYGSFAPIKAEEVEDHKMHSEYFEISGHAADKINAIRSSGGKVFAVGTTSTRVLEASASKGKDAVVSQGKGQTDLFIYPGYTFKAVGALITNFHLPESSLMLLVSAFAGKDLLKEAYAEAIRDEYRFFSYGDAMIII